MEGKIFYMAKSRRIAFAVFAMFLAILYIGLIFLIGPINEHYSIDDVLQGVNIIFLVFVTSALYFTLKTNIPLLRFNDNMFYYNSLILKEGIRDGVLFPLFPYFYTSLSTSKRYTDLENIKREKNGVFIYKLKSDIISRNPMLLQLGAFSRSDSEEIIEIFNQKIK